MRSRTLFSALATALVISTTANSASFDLGITGTITPASCVPTLGNSNIAYGNIPTEMLSADKETFLPMKSTTYTIICDAAVKVALKIKDNRHGTQSSPTENFQIFEETVGLGPSSFGLGTDASGNKIGLWVPALNVASITTDTESGVDVLYSGAATPNWVKIPKTSVRVYNGTYRNDVMNTFAKKGELTPLALTTVNGILEIQPVIAPASTLDLTEPVALNGSATIELVYL